MEDKIMQYEQNKLREIVEGLNETLEGEELKLKALPRKYGNNPILLQSLMSMTSQKIYGIKTHIDKPYFSRIDFKSMENGKKEQLYIGKVGVIDLDGNILVTDWRAPIASLYYDSNLGQVEYVAPDGVMKGTLELKRQIVIENQEIKEIFDVDSVSDDELLKPYLGANADNRLKNIVASIQKEQNEIIRKPLYQNVIVQGVAGSGKTTVALHRIAYLIYNYSKKYHSNQFMVIGPNKFFINYISNVLPDLDAGQVEQWTFEELALKFVAEKMSVSNATEKLVSILSGNQESGVSKYKLSMIYKEELDKFLEKFEYEFVPKEGISINGFCLFSKEEVCDMLQSEIEIDFSSRLSRLQKVIENKVENMPDLTGKIKEHFNTLLRNAKTDSERQEITKLQWDTIDKVNTELKNILKKKFTVKNKKVITLYKSFITNYKKYSLNNSMCQKIQNATMGNVNSKKFNFEDLPALMYIKYKLFGCGEFKDFAHVVVDEAQDFGTFNFFVLKKMMQSSTFSIFGDLTQGIYEYRSINNWEEVIRSSFDGKCSLMQLEKSYRTTMEIMKSANLISKSIGLYEGKPVIRHGREVTIHKLNESERISYIQECINQYKASGHQSIAIICKTPEESKRVYERMVQMQKDITLIAEDNEIYDGGVCVVPSHLSKGLEFDCVLIYDANEQLYSSNNKVDMKLLYVAMTRALHTLDILYSKDITKPLIGLSSDK